MRCSALPCIDELAVALPDDRAVLVGGMPDLGALGPATTAADQSGGEDGFGGMLMLFLISFLKLLMGHVELFRCDDRLMAILNEELPGLPVVSLTLCKKILLEGLLEDGLPPVLVHKNARLMPGKKSVFLFCYCWTKLLV